MDINFVLNDCPTSSTSSRSTSTAFNIGVIRSTAAFKIRPQNSESSSVFSHNPTAEHHLSQLVSTYNPYQHSNNPSTISSRSSYSGPSLQSSTAATSPLEVPMTSHHLVVNASFESACSGSSEQGESAIGSCSSFPGRHLPPLSSNSHPSALPSSSEGALSPRSTSHHYHHQITSDIGGYFSSASSHPYTYGSQYQSSIYSSPQQNHAHGYDALLNFAEVAMGTATPSGRRSLEVEAAAEALASRRGSGGSLRHLDSSARSSSSHIMVGSNQHFQMDIDPELRPASPGSIASTGRTIEEEASMINIGDNRSTQTQRSIKTRTIDHTYNRDTPLFRPAPEVSAPRQEPITISADSGPSTNNAGTGPLHIPSSPHDFLNQAPKCSYCSICTTGSPLRKVVSHIFGRNKLSTRQIPKNVWVYYCRKHYQRSRYRNPRGFARQQVLLVRRQCERLELWGGVKDWMIKVRRREELRMNREGGENGEEIDDEDELEDNAGADDELEPNDGGPTSGESSRRNSTATARRRSSTGGNNWIMRHTGMEKTIDDIYRLLERIEIEVQENGGKFPDVELLPNVDLAMAVPIRGPDGDGDEGGSGNTGGGENQEGADDDGVTDRTIGKKRRRSDGGSGSSGGDDAKGTKKAKSTAVKKGDRKGKGKAPSHMEATPDEKVLSQSKGAHRFQGAYQRTFSPEVHHKHEVDSMANVAISVFTGRGFKRQTVTPPPSTSASTGRSTPELEPEFITGSSTQKDSITESLYLPSPRRSARILPPAIIDNSKNPLHYSSISLQSSKSYMDLKSRQLTQIGRTDVFTLDDLTHKWQR